MTDRFALGSIARLFLDLIVGAAGATGQTPTVAIKRESDGKWFQFADLTWQPTIVENPMAEVDSTNEPGRYQFDFDQATDVEDDSRDYTVKYKNTGAPLHLSYEKIGFGPIGDVAEPGLCAVTGTILSLQGRPVANTLVRATLVPTFTDSLGRTVQTEVVDTYSNELGNFSLSLVRGTTCRFEIERVGYDRKIVVPDQATVLFTDL